MPDCFCEITACEIYLMGVHIAILRAHVYSLRTCFFFILFLVSVGSIEQHSCESQQIIARRRLSKWCRKGVKILRKKNYYDKRMMMKLGFLIVQTIVAKVVSTLVALIK